jgi:hypothetical protein
MDMRKMEKMKNSTKTAAFVVLFAVILSISYTHNPIQDKVPKFVQLGFRDASMVVEAVSFSALILSTVFMKIAKVVRVEFFIFSVMSLGFRSFDQESYILFSGMLIYSVVFYLAHVIRRMRQKKGA